MQVSSTALPGAAAAVACGYHWGGYVLKLASAQVSLGAAARLMTLPLGPEGTWLYPWNSYPCGKSGTLPLGPHVFLSPCQAPSGVAVAWFRLTTQDVV